MTTPFTGTYTSVQTSDNNNYTITFKSNGNITFTNSSFAVSYIVVGGGGGGGNGIAVSGGSGYGGGGGGGAVSLGSFYNNPNVNYTVTIGEGGVGAILGSYGKVVTGSSGNPSSLVSTIINCVSNGGENGISSVVLLLNQSKGGSSGSGGLGGNVGQNGSNGGGGGGGLLGGNGGNGSLSNNNTLYGGGGGGGGGGLNQAIGVGGGGNGSNSNQTNGYSGTPNTGGGGGGGGGNVGINSGGNGGSGIVILFYSSLPETNLITYNPNIGINEDFNKIFTPYSGGIKAPQTNYTINGVDLNLIFDPSSVGQSINFNTGYIANGLDLRYIFNTPYYYVDRSLSSSPSIRNFGYMSQMDCSYDGKYCIAAPVANGQYGAVFISSNTGQTWTALYPDGNTSPTANPTNWQVCSCSSTGQIMIAGTTTKLYKSTDYGVNWNQISTTSSYNLRGCASNADCSRIYMSTASGPIICLNGSGTLIYNTTSGHNSNGITTNNTGQYVYYVTNGAGVFYSSNYGQAFTSSTTTGNGTYNNWSPIKCDNTGKYVYASEIGSKIVFYSNNYGVTFNVMINPNTIPGSPSNIQGCLSITCDGTGNVVTIATFPESATTTTGGGVYQTKNALININNNTPPLATSWSVIGNSTAFAQDSYWTSVASDNNTGQLLVMSTAVEASRSFNGGLYTYNMFT